MNQHVLDIHTHHKDGKPGEAIICKMPQDFVPTPGYWYSVGIHPWEVLNIHGKELLDLHSLAQHHQVVAIGETGFDRIRPLSQFTQTLLFGNHSTIADEVGKPLIIHMVKAADLLLAEKKKLNPQVPWVIHGFRGKPQEAEQLLNAGLYLSFGEHYNVDTLRATPLDRLFLETDEATCGIDFIYNKVATDLGMAVERLKEVVKKNIDCIFFNGDSRLFGQKQ